MPLYPPATTASADLAAHLADTVDAHDASATSVADAGSLLTAAEVEAALQEFGLKVVGYSAHGNTGSTETFSALTGWHSATLNAACTFTLTAAPTGTSSQLFLELLQDGTGGWAITLPASVSNKSALEAAQVTTASGTTFLGLWSRDGGTTWYGSWIGAAAASGSVATDAIWDAKGDLAGGTGANTAAKLTVGANDTILMADSAQSTGLKWVASQTPSTQAFSDAAAQGTADTYARGDHVHGMPSAGSGAVATDTLWDAAGDLAQGTGANTAAKLTAGTSGYVLTSNGPAAAVSWQAPSGGGSALAHARVAITGGNYVSSNTSATDMTSMTVTLTTGANPCHVSWVLSAFSTSSSADLIMDIAIDGTLQGGTQGLIGPTVPGSSRLVNLSGAFDTATLSAASHTIKIQVWTNAGTATFLSGTGSPAILSVAEFAV